jgi:hypothetical protein
MKPVFLALPRGPLTIKEHGFFVWSFRSIGCQVRCGVKDVHSLPYGRPKTSVWAVLTETTYVHNTSYLAHHIGKVLFSFDLLVFNLQ